MLKILAADIKTVLSNVDNICVMSLCGLKHIPPPPSYEEYEFPPKGKWHFMQKVPQYPSTLKPPKMFKNLRFMRGPELVHNTLLHKQYGIVALSGGRLRFGHFEMIRLGIVRKLDHSRMFAIWRVDPPWQPITKKGQGQRMGGGKGAIDHYVTPVKEGRIIMELGGKCEFAEVEPILRIVAHNLPFKALVINQKMLDAKFREEKRVKEENKNPYTFKYVVQNNLGGCHKWIKPIDKKYFGEYL